MKKNIILVLCLISSLAYAFFKTTDEQSSFYVDINATNRISLGESIQHEIIVSNKTSSIIIPEIQYGFTPKMYNGILYTSVTNFTKKLELQPYMSFVTNISIEAESYINIANFTGLFELVVYVSDENESWFYIEQVHTTVTNNMVSFSKPLPLKVGQSSLATIEFKNPLSFPLEDVSLRATFTKDYALSNGIKRISTSTQVLQPNEILTLQTPVEIVNSRSGQIIITVKRGNRVLFYTHCDTEIEP